jgi:hypothetical protein
MVLHFIQKNYRKVADATQRGEADGSLRLLNRCPILSSIMRSSSCRQKSRKPIA